MGVISNAEAAEGRRSPGWSPPPARRLSVLRPRSPEKIRALAGILADPSLREHQVSGEVIALCCRIEPDSSLPRPPPPTDAGTQPSRMSDPVVCRTPAPPFPRFPGAGPGPVPPDPPQDSASPIVKAVGRAGGSGPLRVQGSWRFGLAPCFSCLFRSFRPVPTGGVWWCWWRPRVVLGGGVIPIPQPVGEVSSISSVDVVGDFELEPQDHAAVFAGCGRMGMGCRALHLPS